MKTTTKYRDLLLFIALLCMVKVAWNLPSKHSLAQPMLTATSSDQEVPAEHTVTKEFSIHEADPDVLSQIEDLQKQIDQAIELVETSSTQAALLQSMKQRLTQFKREYKYTSPAVALLGPIGYTGIVVKEQRIEKGILKITNALNSILHEHAQLDDKYVPTKEIAQGIEIGHTILAQVTSSETIDPETVN